MRVRDFGGGFPASVSWIGARAPVARRRSLSTRVAESGRSSRWADSVAAAYRCASSSCSEHTIDAMGVIVDRWLIPAICGFQFPGEQRSRRREVQSARRPLLPRWLREPARRDGLLLRGSPERLIDSVHAPARGPVQDLPTMTAALYEGAPRQRVKGIGGSERHLLALLPALARSRGRSAHVRAAAG